MLLDVIADGQRIKEMTKKAFDEDCERGLHTVKFHLLDHIGKHLTNFGYLHVLNSSPLAQYNVHVKSPYRSTSQRRRKRLQEAVKIIDNCQIRTRTSLKRTCCGHSQSFGDERDWIGQNGPFLGRDGVRARL